MRPAWAKHRMSGNECRNPERSRVYASTVCGDDRRSSRSSVSNLAQRTATRISCRPSSTCSGRGSTIHGQHFPEPWQNAINSTAWPGWNFSGSGTEGQHGGWCRRRYLQPHQRLGSNQSGSLAERPRIACDGSADRIFSRTAARPCRPAQPAAPVPRRPRTNRRPAPQYKAPPRPSRAAP